MTPIGDIPAPRPFASRDVVYEKLEYRVAGVGGCEP